MTIAVGFSVHNMNRCCPNAHVRVLFIDKKRSRTLTLPLPAANT